MRTNPKEGPALEQAITGYNDSKGITMVLA